MTQWGKTAISLLAHPSSKNESRSHRGVCGTRRNIELRQVFLWCLFQVRIHCKTCESKSRWVATQMPQMNPTACVRRLTFKIEPVEENPSTQFSTQSPKQASHTFLRRVFPWKLNSWEYFWTLLLSKSQLNCLSRWCYFMANRLYQYCRKMIFKQTRYCYVLWKG